MYWRWRLGFQESSQTNCTSQYWRYQISETCWEPRFAKTWGWRNLPVETTLHWQDRRGRQRASCILTNGKWWWKPPTAGKWISIARSMQQDAWRFNIENLCLSTASNNKNGDIKWVCPRLLFVLDRFSSEQSLFVAFHFYRAGHYSKTIVCMTN